MDISEAVSIASAAVKDGLNALEQFLAPIDPVFFIFACFVIGLAVGLYLGKKKGFKEFFKPPGPGAHWRIRRNLRKQTP